MGRGSQLNSILQTNDQVVSRTKGIVHSIILGKEGESYRDIGSVYVRKDVTDSSISSDNLIKCRPKLYDENNIPLVNEIVEIVKTYSGATYYERLHSPDLNIANAVDGIDDVYIPNVERSSSNKTKDYKEVSTTNIPKSSSNPNESSKTSKDFKKTNINKLRLYEGDKLIESRFGQSIRFSGYNFLDDSNSQQQDPSPTIIIRNRQNDDITDKEQIISENVNTDGTSIVLSSGQYKINYQTTVKTNPLNFELPEELVGYDQFLLNSDRVILSAKSQEMIFFSKGNYGFISDGKFTIDNGGGADLDFGDDVNITTDRNNGDFSVNTGTGGIYLNTNNKNEPLVRGTQLVSFLQTLTDILINFQTIGPNGPNTTSPSIQTQITDLQAQLENLKSTLNFTE